MSNYQFVRHTPPKKILRNLAIVVAVILAIVFIVPPVHGAIVGSLDERRARNEMLYDLDFITTVLAENFPYFPMIYRRTGNDIPMMLLEFREEVADRSRPVMTVDEFEGALQYLLLQGDARGHLSVNRGYASLRPTSSEDNLHTEIIEEGRIAFIGVNRMGVHGSRSGNSVMNTCRAIVDPFLQEIGGFEHLILDIRRNSGGIGGYFEQLIMRPLRHMFLQDLPVTYIHHLIRSGEYNESRTDELRSRASGSLFFSGIGELEELTEAGSDALLDALGFDYLPEYVLNDLMEMDFHFRQRFTLSLAHIQNPIPFDGRIWLLVDEWTASAAQQAALLARDIGFATLVGSTTRGIASFGFFVELPNTGIMVRYDPTYTLDRYGRPLEYGILPHYFNREGMDALETVLAMIAEMNEY